MMSFSSRSDSTALLSWEGLIFYYQLRGFMNNSKLKQIFENLISLVEEKNGMALVMIYLLFLHFGKGSWI